MIALATLALLAAAYRPQLRIGRFSILREKMLFIDLHIFLLARRTHAPLRRLGRREPSGYWKRNKRTRQQVRAPAT
jgi:hypothetical protein